MFKLGKRLKLWANRKKKSLGLFLCCALKRNIDSRNKKDYIQQQEQQSKEDDQVTNEEEEVISEKLSKSEDNIVSKYIHAFCHSNEVDSLCK